MIAFFVLAGQSNLDQWFHANDGAALDAFKDTFLALNPEYTDVQFFDAARGGSAILSGSATEYADRRAADDPELYARISENYWYDETTGTAGPNLTLFTDRIEAEVASGTQFLGVIWAQGEADTAYVGTSGTEDYAEGLAYVLDALMQASGAEQTYIQALGDRAFYSESLHGGTDAIRAAQQEIADSSDVIKLASTIFDLNLRDSVHLTDADYMEAARRMAVAISTGETAPDVGETILLNPTTLLIQLDLATSQSILGGFTLNGFTLTDDGTEVEIAAATMTDAGLLRIETSVDLITPTLSYASATISSTMVAGDYIFAQGPNGTTAILPFTVTLSDPRHSVTEIDGGLRIDGTALSETLTGLSGNDLIAGDAGHDMLDGGWGNDTLSGGDGKDTFVMGEDGSHDVVLDFDVSRDAIGLMGASADGVTFSADDAGLLVTTADGQSMWLSGLGTGDAGKIIFHILGTDGSNTLLGHDGGDRIFAHGGDDRIDSGAGTDRITTGEGADTILFGTGYGLNVVYDFDLTEDSIELTDLLGSDLTFLQYKHTDLEIKTEAGDRLVLRNIDLADAGLVTIIDAPPTHGVLMGTEGRDTLQGTALDELFIPLGDTDRLYGGLGSDVFDFREGYDLNVIYDFEDGIDRILIDAAVFDTLTILAYKDTDAEIRLASGDRLVLRDVDFNAIDADDFIFDLPEAFA